MHTFKIEEEATHVLRGGERFTLDRTQYHDAGLRKVMDYGEGRYLRDGAPSVITFKCTKADVPAWKKLKVDTEDESFKLTTGAMAVLVKAKATLPGGWTLDKLGKELSAKLNAGAITHAEARRDALYSGDITEGRISSTAPEVPYLRKFVATVLVKFTGIKISKVPKLPGTIDALRETFIGYDGLTLPVEIKKKGVKDLGTWFDRAHTHATAAVQAERDAQSDLI